MADKFGNGVSAILNTILERCKKEKDNGCLFIGLEDYYERVSYYTAFSKTLIQQVTGVADNFSNKRQFNLDSHMLLMISIKLLLQGKIAPTLTTVHNIFIQNKERCLGPYSKVIISSLPNFCSQITALKYEFRKTASGSVVLLENPNVTFERYQYLSKKKSLNPQKTIYYIDERIINANLSFSKPTVNNKNSQGEYTLFLMISSNGYEHGLFTSHATQEVYQNWIENIVMSMLKPSSTIVMTNSYLHGNEKNPITAYHTKQQMMQWLRDNDVPHCSDMCRPELYDLIKKCTPRTKQNNIDGLFKSYGHEVLHLPTTFEEISPIEYLWEHVQSEEFLTQNDDVYAAKNKLYNYLTTITDKIWQGFMEKNKKVEYDIFCLDKEIEDNYENVYILDDQYDLEASCVCNFYHSIVSE